MAGVESRFLFYSLFQLLAGDDLSNGGQLTEAEKELLREELKKVCCFELNF
jgi:hypothetical protein